MKTLVVYASMTGNTKKLAEAIAGVFGVEANPCAQVKTVDKVDLLVVGSGVYGGKMGQDMIRFLNNLPVNAARNAVVFGTIGGQTGAVDSMAELLKDKGIEVNGTFYCKGQFIFFVNHGHPNSQDLEAAREFAANIKAELSSAKSK